MKTEEYLHEEIKALREKLKEAEARNLSWKLRFEEQVEMIRNLKVQLGVAQVPFEGYVS